MKSPPALTLLSLLLLIVLGGTLYFYFPASQPVLQIFPATVQRDCAPWDGAAFTVQISMPDGSILDLSIWQSPEMPLPTSFRFPDEIEQVGSAWLVSSSGMPQQLAGEVKFQSVRQGTPLEGRFSLTSEGGEQFQGTFVAEWDDQIVLCG